MARMNPNRRRKAAQAKLYREIVNAHGKAHDDSHMLQQGKVRSSYTRLEAQSPQNVRSIAYRANARPDGYAPSSYKDGARTVMQRQKLAPAIPQMPTPTATLRAGPEAPRYVVDSVRDEAARLQYRRSKD